MATLNWPSGRHFTPATFAVSVSTPKQSFVAVYTGQVQSVSMLADRAIWTMTLPPCFEPEAGEREAFFAGLASSGDLVRLWHMQRSAPKGTLRGSPTVAAAAAAGARTISVNTTAGATLRAGDILGTGSQLLQVAYGGATANGAGLIASLPLVLPLRKSVASGAALTWNAPTGVFQLVEQRPQLVYSAPRVQAGLELTFSEVVS